MDGNGRWADERGLPVAAGHRAGTRALRRTVEAAIDLGVESLAVYAFSTENWSRPAGRGRRADGDLRRDDRARAPRPRRAGRPHALLRPPRPRAATSCSEDGASSRRRPRERAGSTSGSPSTTAAAPSSSRPRGGSSRRRRAGRDVDEDVARRAPLRARRCPTRTSLIRTSGELRISNFLLWQLAYAGARLRRHALAGLRRARPARGARRVRPPPAALRRAMSRATSRSGRASLVARRRRCRSCSALVWLGGWWLFALPRRRR